MNKKKWIVNNWGLKNNEYSYIFNELKKKLMNSE